MVHSSKSHPTRIRLKKHGASELSKFASVLATCLGSKMPELGASIEHHSFTDPYRFKDEYLLHSVVSKFEHHEAGIDKRQVALESFWESEQHCLRLNTSGYTPRSSSKTTAFDCETVINRARRKIEYILESSDIYREIANFVGHSTGASFNHKRVKGDQYYKFGSMPHVTLNCAALFKKLTRDTLYERLWPNLERAAGAKCDFVPKSYKTDRLICVEPHGNMYVQKGIGGFIRRRLKRVGIDLNDQTVNQELARVGSVDGSLATIDLKAASDSISLRLCRDLLPPAFYDLLLMARSEKVLLPDGTWHELEKISSMGNGFTFELESLLFYGLVSSCVEESKCDINTVSIYGDDIICASSIAEYVIDVLAYVGFQTNEDKTFYTSFFRESCGKHWFSGVDVTPFFIKGSLTETRTITLACNALRLWEGRDTNVASRIKPAYDYFVSLLPRWLREPRLPVGFGDSALVGTLDECKPKFSFELFCFKTKRVPAVRSNGVYYKNLSGFLLKQLHDSYERGVSLSLSKPAFREKLHTIAKTMKGKVVDGTFENTTVKCLVQSWSDPPIFD